VGRQRANGDAVALAAVALKPLVVQVDEMLGRGEPRSSRDQAMAPGERPGLVAECRLSLRRRQRRGPV